MKVSRLLGLAAEQVEDPRNILGETQSRNPINSYGCHAITQIGSRFFPAPEKAAREVLERFAPTKTERDEAMLPHEGCVGYFGRYTEDSYHAHRLTAMAFAVTLAQEDEAAQAADVSDVAQVDEDATAAEEE